MSFKIPRLLCQPFAYFLVGVLSVIPPLSHSATTAAGTALTAYKVQKGDTLRGVANKFNLNVAELAKYNNKKITDKLVMDEVLLLSGDDVAKVVSKIKPDALKYVSPTSATAINTTTTVTYSVKAGETLNGIANRNNTTPNEILRLNNLKPDTKLAIGQKLRLPAAPKTVVKPAEKVTLKEGGKQVVIATPKTDTKANPPNSETNPKPTEKTPTKIVETKPSATVKITDYTVVSGDSLIKLANRYHIGLTDLAKMNQLKTTDSLKIGQKVLVPIAVLNVNEDKK